MFNNAQDHLFFIHVPKCQGTTLNSLFSASLPAERALTSEQQDLFSILFSEASAMNEYRYIGGHFPNWLHIAKFPNKKLIVVVRDPVKRFNSILKHGFRDVAFRGHLPELWETNKPLTVFKNIAKRNLWINVASAGSYCASSDLPKFSSVDGFYEDVFSQIEKFDYLIADTDFDNYFLDFAFKLNMPPIEAAPVMRPSANYESNTLEFKEVSAKELKKYFPWEFDLYDRVKKKSESQSPVRPKLDVWKKNYEEYWRTMDRSNFYCFSADMPIKGYGWYPRANLNLVHIGVHYKYGIKFEGSGAFVDIPLGPEMKNLRGAIFCEDAGLPQQLKITLNSKSCKINWPISIVKNVISFSIDLNSENVGDLYTRVEIEYNGETKILSDVFLLELLAH